MILNIQQYGNPILRKQCKPIEEITDEVRKLVADMIDTMDKGNGCGLAAPQVGYALRLFVLRDYIVHEDGHWTLSDPKVYINPKLTNPGACILTDVEGCLSLPGLRLDIDRPDRITVEALDIDGKPFTEEVEGYNARIRMHENDHINGVLFIDRVDEKTRHKIDPLLREMKKKYKP
ncbi:MAG: peptide deformylase [Parachlamydiales bacterium]|nr:peptide deformylase [Candidatus Acheromyda pituitae]